MRAYTEAAQMTLQDKQRQLLSHYYALGCEVRSFHDFARSYDVAMTCKTQGNPPTSPRVVALLRKTSMPIDRLFYLDLPWQSLSPKVFDVRLRCADFT